MKCHYTYTENGEKVLIPGCIGTAAMGIEHCTCRSENPPACFERKRYNKTVNALRAEIKELERENACLNRMIKKIYRKNENRTRRTTETKNRL